MSNGCIIAGSAPRIWDAKRVFVTTEGVSIRGRVVEFAAREIPPRQSKLNCRMNFTEFTTPYSTLHTPLRWRGCTGWRGAAASGPVRTRRDARARPCNRPTGDLIRRRRDAKLARTCHLPTGDLVPRRRGATLARTCHLPTGEFLCNSPTGEFNFISNCVRVMWGVLAD